MQRCMVCVFFFWNVNNQPTNTVKDLLPTSRFFDSTSGSTEFCQLMPPNMKRYETPPRTRDGILCYFVSNKILKICFIGHGEISIFKWAAFTALDNNIVLAGFSLGEYECCSKMRLNMLLWFRATLSTITAEILAHPSANFHSQWAGRHRPRIYNLCDASSMNYNGQFDSLLS